MIPDTNDRRLTFFASKRELAIQDNQRLIGIYGTYTPDKIIQHFGFLVFQVDK